MTLYDIASILKGSGSIAILPHVAADGDALGSCLGLALAMSKQGRTVKVILEEDIPQVYGFMPGRELAEVAGTTEAAGAAGGPGYDMALALDTGDTGRLGRRLEIFARARTTVNIDHHTTNTGFALHNYVDTGASAVGEIIFRLLEIMGAELSPDIATCLYVAIATDTGGFRYSNTTPLTHETAAALIKCGVNVAEVSQLIFDSTSLGKVRLLGAAIQALELAEEGRVALITLENGAFRQTGAKEEDCDGIVNIGRNIQGVKVAAMLRKWDNGEIKVNLRSSSRADVSAIAERYGGGGHKKAAGFTTTGELAEIKRKLLDDIAKIL